MFFFLQDSDSDSEDEKEGSRNAVAESPLPDALLPPAPAEIDHTRYQVIRNVLFVTDLKWDGFLWIFVDFCCLSKATKKQNKTNRTKTIKNAEQIPLCNQREV